MSYRDGGYVTEFFAERVTRFWRHRIYSDLSQVQTKIVQKFRNKIRDSLTMTISGFSDYAYKIRCSKRKQQLLQLFRSDYGGSVDAQTSAGKIDLSLKFTIAKTCKGLDIVHMYEVGGEGDA